MQTTITAPAPPNFSRMTAYQLCDWIFMADAEDAFDGRPVPEDHDPDDWDLIEEMRVELEVIAGTLYAQVLESFRASAIILQWNT